MATNKLRYPHIAARVFDTPLLIQQSKLLSILRVLGPRLGFDIEGQPGVKTGMMEDEHYAPPDPFQHMEHLQALGISLEPMGEGHFVGEGVAIIPVTGSLVQRSDWMSDTSGMLSYASIERMMNAALDDPRVKELLWEFDTPGGEVAGAFDFADRIYARRDEKPMTAVVNELAASAGYLLASAVGNIALSRTASVGSIGVVGAHIDYSRMMEKRGTAITFIYAGEKKIDGNPYEPLPAAVKAEWQAEINGLYDLFVETVSRNTGLSVDKVRGTKAGMFSGSAALDVGLAARVNTFTNEFKNAMNRAKEARAGGFYPSMTRAEQSEKWQALGIREQTIQQWHAETAGTEETASTSETTEKETAMSTQKPAAPAAAAPAAEQPPAAAPAPAAAAPAAAVDNSAAIAEAVKADRARCKAIAELPEAKGREQLASKLADQGMSVEQAKDLLAAAPKKTGLDEMMESLGSPRIGSQTGSETVTTAAMTPAAVFERRSAVFSGRQTKD